MINPITGWLNITQYKGVKVMTIANIVENMYMGRYLWPTEIPCDLVL